MKVTGTGSAADVTVRLLTSSMSLGGTHSAPSTYSTPLLKTKFNVGASGLGTALLTVYAKSQTLFWGLRLQKQVPCLPQL